MALKPEQLQTAGLLYNDLDVLYTVLARYKELITQEQPRQLSTIQYTVDIAKRILQNWHATPRAERLLKAGFKSDTQANILTVLYAIESILTPAFDLSPGLDKQPDEGVLSLKLLVLFGLLSELDGCLLAIISEWAASLSKADSKKIHPEYENLLKWCRRLKRLETNELTAKNWQEIERMAILDSFPETFCAAIYDRDESSYWLQPWQFRQWQELYEYQKTDRAKQIGQLFWIYFQRQQREKQSSRFPIFD